MIGGKNAVAQDTPAGRLAERHKIVRLPNVPLEGDVLGNDEREGCALVGITTCADADEFRRSRIVDDIGWRGECLARPFAH